MARDTGSGAEVSAIKAWKEMQHGATLLKKSNQDDPQACTALHALFGTRGEDLVKSPNLGEEWVNTANTLLEAQG